MRNFGSAKVPQEFSFSAKNRATVDFVSTFILNKNSTSDFVKLTMPYCFHQTGTLDYFRVQLYSTLIKKDWLVGCFGA